MYLYAKKIPPVFSVRSTVYTLNSVQDNSSAGKLSELIGGSGMGGSSAKGATDEANVSIEEVGISRKVREAVVSERLMLYGNKTIGELLINEHNRHVGLMGKKIEMPSSDSAIAGLASALIQPDYSFKFNKRGLLELVYSSTDQKLLQPVSYVLLDKIALFYKELKIEKAKKDYEFINAKVDSFQDVMDRYDRQRIEISNHSLFVPDNKLQYLVPRENLETDKLRVLGQRNGAALNREEALWKLQKVTPIIQVLDKPEPPYIAVQPSAKIYAIGGFLVGCILFTLLFISGILYKYINGLIRDMINPQPAKNTTTTA